MRFSLKEEEMKKTLQLLIVVVLLMGSVAGCAYRYKFKTGLPPSDQKQTQWHHIGLWGHIYSGPFNLEQACPEGTAEFGSYINFGNWLPAFLTIGLYSPRTVYAICAQPQDGGL
jgi:hypothetical protein